MLGPARFVYVVVKPQPALARYIAAHPRATAKRGPELLHITIQPLGDRLEFQSELLSLILRIMAIVDAPPFRVVFDRIVDSGRTIALCGSEPTRGAQAFRAALIATLNRHGLSLPPHRFTPHMTIAYQSDGLGNEDIDPISWRVEEFLLVESIIPEGRHELLGRWPLRDPS